MTDTAIIIGNWLDGLNIFDEILFYGDLIASLLDTIPFGSMGGRYVAIELLVLRKDCSFRIWYSTKGRTACDIVNCAVFSSKNHLFVCRVELLVILVGWRW